MRVRQKILDLLIGNSYESLSQYDDDIVDDDYENTNSYSNNNNNNYNDLA